MKLYRKILIVASLMMLAACSSAPKQNTAKVSGQGEDMCGAAAQQSYVGKPLSSLDGVRFATPMRAIPYHSAVTMDFNPHRLNFIGDKAGIITHVRCG
ncbi:hypothetical protein PMPD1_1138 [Paramixta manurensis]|uniref:Peptidase inhibitor I78 family protein n=1 Tax=Paramixta manurensis TaxID=2740817 RepID=A0A6M8UL12_9GAMM|nr:hypothetical protein PMPD1_1138 [Erwiniaceae bacterium PD-1]